MKRTFYTLIFLAFTFSNTGYAGQEPDGILVSWFKWVARPFIKYGAGQQALKNTDNIEKFMLNNPNLKTLAESSQAIAEASNVLAEAAIKVAKDSEVQTAHFIKMSNTIERVATSVGFVIQIAGVVTVLKAGKDAAVWTQEHLKPGHEQQLKTTTVKMHKCLFDFKNASKDQNDLPIGCRKQLDSFERLAGPVALEQVRNAYNK